MSDNTNSAHEDPIDAVIMWVDGNDPQLAAKRNSYLKGDSTNIGSGAHSTRFASLNEIKYCILSIFRFALSCEISSLLLMARILIFMETFRNGSLKG